MDLITKKLLGSIVFDKDSAIDEYFKDFYDDLVDQYNMWSDEDSSEYVDLYDNGVILQYSSDCNDIIVSVGGFHYGLKDLFSDYDFKNIMIMNMVHNYRYIDDYQGFSDCFMKFLVKQGKGKFFTDGEISVEDYVQTVLGGTVE